jgi:hypothetical protein
MMRQFLVIISVIMLGAVLVLAVQTIQLAKQHQLVKIDRSDMNHIRYGLLNVDEWAGKVADITSKKIEEFEITPENRDQLQNSVEEVLYALVDQVEELMEERTSGSFSGVKRWVAGFALDVEQLRDSVPAFASIVIDELNDPENRAELQAFILDKLENFVDNTYNKDSMELLRTLLAKYGCDGRPECQAMLGEEIGEMQRQINFRVIALLVLVILIFMVNLLPGGELNVLQAPVLILTSLSLLLCGIITPMIQLEARIDMIIFQLLGEEISFSDQIIFFQSKSITDMVGILMSEGTVQMIFVAILIFSFSVLFPSLKLLSSYVYYMDLGNLRNNAVVKFFVLKSGKWSMADVMVVALFMAYIGFNGVIASQLSMIDEKAQSFEVFTTNGTMLLGGFYLFLGFCIAGLILSEALNRRSRGMRRA